jgi:hypothetical protein
LTIDGDVTAPVIVPTVIGTLGAGGWFTSNVAVSWTVTDPDSAFTTSGCGPTTISSDTSAAGIVLTCSATSAGGASAQSVTLKRDATAPAIAISSPLDGATLTLNSVVSGNYMCSDAHSGVTSCVGSVPVGNPVDTASLGVKTFTVTAADGAGNPFSKSVSYTVGRYTSTFSGLTASQVIVYGTPSVTLSGVISAGGPAYPPSGEIVSVTVNGVTANATVNASGLFTATINSQTFAATAPATPYVIRYDYAGNADFIGATDTSTALGVSRRPAAVTPSAASKIYGSSDPGFTGLLSGFLPADSIVAVYARAAGESVAGSPYQIAATLAPATALSNYAITYNTANFTILPALLTITADDKSKVAGAAVPPLTASFSGFVAGDTELSLVTPPVFSTTATSTSPGGTYPIVVSGATQPNYDIHFVPGTLTISSDTTAPLIVPSVIGTLGSGGWFRSNVAVSWTVTDPDSAFTTSGCGPTTISSDTSAAGITLTCSATSAGGTSAQSVTVKRDATAPAIVISAPQDGATLTLNSVVSANYTCSDVLSGVTSCIGSVPVGNQVDTASAGVKTFTVTATDAAGNPFSNSVSYKVGFDVCLLYDPTRAVKSGSTLPVKIQLCSGDVNQSSAARVVTALAVRKLSNQTTSEVLDSGNANPDSNFRFEPGLAGYIFNLSTRGLTTGTYALTFTATGDPTVHEVRFAVK